MKNIPDVPKKRPTFDLMYFEKPLNLLDLLEYFLNSHILTFKIWCKAIRNLLKVRQAMANEAKISGPADDRRPDIFKKMHLFKAAILLYQGSMECEKRHNCLT